MSNAVAAGAVAIARQYFRGGVSAQSTSCSGFDLGPDNGGFGDVWPSPRPRPQLRDCTKICVSSVVRILYVELYRAYVLHAVE